MHLVYRTTLANSIQTLFTMIPVRVNTIVCAQVESLFRHFHTRRTLRIRVVGKGGKTGKEPLAENGKDHDGDTEETGSTHNSNSDTEE